jgi:hypothetical protein
MSAPSDTLIGGMVHKQAQVNIMSKGVAKLRAQDGEFVEVRAPQIFLGAPGRKVAYVIEDMVWLNVFATDERDVETVERMFIEDSPALIEHKKTLMLTRDTQAFNAMLAECGYSPEGARVLCEQTDDMIEFPIGEYKIKVGHSLIDGRGIIATADISAGEVICHARIDGKRTPAGRYTNHSDTPNAEMIVLSGNLYLRAVNHIEGCRGGLDGEEVTINYRQVFELRRRLKI